MAKPNFARLTLLSPATPSVAFTRFSDKPGSCQIIGDTGFYGSGVGIGLYLQCAAIFVALFVVPGESVSVFIAADFITLFIFISLLSGVSENNIVTINWTIVILLTLVPFCWIGPCSTDNIYRQFTISDQFLCAGHHVQYTTIPKCHG